ncbi:caspase family protein [Burkholderiaceae bacterium]|nr:caspase family protein [Burkholderiaceae bacterium]
MTELICKRLLLLTVLFGLAGCVTTPDLFESSSNSSVTCPKHLPSYQWNSCVGYAEYGRANYLGEFHDGVRSGRGKLSWNFGGVVKDGFWVNDEFVGTLEQAKKKQAELEAQRKETELALARAKQRAQEQSKREAQRLAAQQQAKDAEEAKRKQVELEAQLAAAQEQAKLEAQLAAQQQTQIKPTQSPPLAPQGKRVALVIGNAKYKFSPLKNPVNDATDMATSLRSVGFDVIEVKDATLKQMRAATRQFADKLEVSGVGLVYYSGHGIEVKGKNYLIPVNADIRREYEVVDQAFDASNLLRMMESLQSGTKKRVNILIVDACRNNDLPKSWRSTNNGLARMDAPAGSFISFATAPGQVASDGQGRNSPYTKHLLQALKQPGMPIEQVFKQVRRKVMAETAGEQVPWENSSLVGDFYFTVAR